MLIADGVMSCLSIVASLCMNTTATAEIQRSTVWSGATVQVGGATITSMVNSDAIVLPDMKNIQRSCKGGTCTLYSGRCAKSSRGLKCTLWYSFTAEMPLRRIDIEGNYESVHRAMKDIRLVRSTDVLVPLSHFHYNAPTDEPPTCYARPKC